MSDAHRNDADDAALTAAKEAIQSCGQRLQRYRAALEAGTDPVLIPQWTAEVQAECVQAEAMIRKLSGRQRMTTEEINSLVSALGGIRAVLLNADPIDRVRVYRSLKLEMTYHPGRKTVTAEARPDSRVHDCVRGSSRTVRTRRRMAGLPRRRIAADQPLQPVSQAAIASNRHRPGRATTRQPGLR
jgi:hypothetical protein